MLFVSFLLHIKSLSTDILALLQAFVSAVRVEKTVLFDACLMEIVVVIATLGGYVAAKCAVTRH